MRKYHHYWPIYSILSVLQTCHFCYCCMVITQRNGKKTNSGCAFRWIAKSYNPDKCPLMIHTDERFILIFNGQLHHKQDVGLNFRDSDFVKANSLFSALFPIQENCEALSQTGFPETKSEFRIAFRKGGELRGKLESCLSRSGDRPVLGLLRKRGAYRGEEILWPYVLKRQFLVPSAISPGIWILEIKNAFSCLFLFLKLFFPPLPTSHYGKRTLPVEFS